MNRLNILIASALMAMTAVVSCDERYDYYKIGKNNPTVTTLEVSEEQIGEDRVTLTGSVRWEQSTSDHSFDGRFAISENPDFPAIAAAYGIANRRVERLADLKAAVQELADAPGAYFLEVDVLPEENVFPMVPAGASLSDTICKG